MSTWLRPGHTTWSLSTDADSHRTYTITFITEGDPREGPANHKQTAGLPIEGDVWHVMDDIDIWAYFRAGPSETKDITSEGGVKKGALDNSLFQHTFTASTRPGDAGSPGGTGGKDDKGSRKKCADQRIENPLAEPPSVKIADTVSQQEEQWDKDGHEIAYTSFEPIVGEQAQFELHREQVVVETNVLNMNRTLLKKFTGLVNDAELYGFPARCWKLVHYDGDRKLYGMCGFYWTRQLILECRAIPVKPGSKLDPSAADPKSRLSVFVVTGSDGRLWLPGWDHYVLDYSEKVLNGHWHWLTGAWVTDSIGGTAPDWTNRKHYINAFDRAFNPVRVVLSKSVFGTPALDAYDANWLRIQRYDDGNYFELNLPASID